MIFRTEFEDKCKKIFDSDSKIGLLSTISGDGYPHITLISSISVKDSSTLMWGQFSQGLSKDNLRENPKSGFLVVSPDQFWWTGKALYSGNSVNGEDFDYFNNKPIFRYNSYFGFGKVHYEKLIDVSVGEKLPLLKIALGFLASGALKRKHTAQLNGSIDSQCTPNENGKIPPYGIKLASGLACLKFISFVDTDGFPRIFPCMQGQIVNSEILVFSSFPYGDLLGQIPSGAKTAIFLANLSLESLLLQGRWYKLERNGGFKNACFETDKVYNSMLPIGGYIYPPEEIPNVFGIK